MPQVTEVETGQFDWSDILLPLTPAQNAADAFAAALPQDGTSRRDTLLRVRASGCVRLPQRMELTRAAADAAPEFAHFEFSGAKLMTEYAADDLDEIAKSGALRMAAEALQEEAENVALSAEDRAVAEAALRRLYSSVRGDAQ